MGGTLSMIAKHGEKNECTGTQAHVPKRSIPKDPFFLIERILNALTRSKMHNCKNFEHMQLLITETVFSAFLLVEC